MSTPLSDKEKGVSATHGAASVADGDDVAHRLEEMGYKQELQRNLGMVAVLGLSFAIMAVGLTVSAVASAIARERGRGSWAMSPTLIPRSRAIGAS